MTYKQFLLAVARECVTDHSGECSGSTAPGPSCGSFKRAAHKDPPCWLSGKRKEHILEKIIPTGLKNAARKCRFCSSRGKRSEIWYISSRCSVPLQEVTAILCITLERSTRIVRYVQSFK